MAPCKETREDCSLVWDSVWGKGRMSSGNTLISNRMCCLWVRDLRITAKLFFVYC